MKKNTVFLNKKGFILVEHLIAIIIIAILMQVFFCIIQLATLYRYPEHQVSQIEIQMIENQIQNEVKFKNKLTSSAEELMLHDEAGSTITYKINANKLIRQVNGTGGEVLLYHCKKMAVTLLDEQSAYLHLTTENNSTYTLYLTTYYNQAILPVSTYTDDDIQTDDPLENACLEDNDCESDPLLDLPLENEDLPTIPEEDEVITPPLMEEETVENI